MSDLSWRVLVRQEVFPMAKLGDVLRQLAREVEQAERDRDQWRAKWEALETTRAACCDQMERERDEARDTAALDEIRAQQRLESLAHDHAKAVAERDEARAMLQETRRRMCRRMGQEEGKSWSALESLASVLRARLAKAEAVVEAAREEHRILARDRARTGWGSNDLIHAMCQASIALSALDADMGGDDPSRAEAATRQVPIGCGVADVDSTGRVIWWEPGGPPPADATKAGGGRCGEWLPAAGKGCALPRGHAGIHDPWQPGEPDPGAPATRAEVEELRRRIDRLESLTDNEE